MVNSIRRLLFRASSWVAGWLIYRGGQLAIKMGDQHEFRHCHAALVAGNSGYCTDDCCELDRPMDARSKGYRVSGLVHISELLDPEGLAKLNAEIREMGGRDIDSHEHAYLEGLEQAREWLVSEEAENGEGGAGQVSEETATRETWRPDAEPWEALREAQRSGAAPVHMAKALSEMGWRLAPAYRGEGKTGSEILADPPESPVLEEPEGEGSDPPPIDTWVLASIDDLRSRVDALESEVRDAHVNASGMSGYFTLGGRLNSMQKRICALESEAGKR